MKRTYVGPLLALGAALLMPAAASAATTIGSTAVPPGQCVGNSGGAQTFVQTTSAGNTHVVPSPGVITAWLYNPGTSSIAASFTFHAFRPGTSGSYTSVGHTTIPSISANLTAYPARISVKTGDILGLTVPTSGVFPCETSTSGYVAKLKFVDPANGSPFSPDLDFPNFRLDIAARIEADGDGDGYGDETQNCSPTDPAVHDGCPGSVGPDTTAPETTITTQPPSKTKRSRAELDFSSSEPGSTFECSFDGDPFSGCLSPKLATVGKGKHVFQVRATDAAGNVDQSPAQATWTVKKKRKKHHHKGGGKH